MAAEQLDHQQRLQQVMERYQLDLLVPTLRLENRWTTNGVQVHALSIAAPLPRFNLPALYLMFKAALLAEGTDPDGEVQVGGRAHRCRKPKKVLALERFRVNPALIKGYKTVRARRLVLRWKSRGFTLTAHGRGMRLVVFKHFSLERPAARFVADLLDRYHYTRFLAVHALQGNTARRLGRYHEIIQEIKFQSGQGWPVRL